MAGQEQEKKEEYEREEQEKREKMEIESSFWKREIEWTFLEKEKRVEVDG